MTRRKRRPRIIIEAEGHAAGRGGAASAVGHSIIEAAGQAAGVGRTEADAGWIKVGEAARKEAKQNAALRTGRKTANANRHDQAKALKEELQKIAYSLRKKYQFKNKKADAVLREVENRIENKAWPYEPVTFDYIYKNIK